MSWETASTRSTGLCPVKLSLPSRPWHQTLEREKQPQLGHLLNFTWNSWGRRSCCGAKRNRETKESVWATSVPARDIKRLHPKQRYKRRSHQSEYNQFCRHQFSALRLDKACCFAVRIYILCQVCARSFHYVEGEE